MDAEEANNISISDEEVTVSSNSSCEARIGVAVTDILPPEENVDNLGMDCSVNDTPGAAVVEPSNISTARTQHVAFNEDEATEAGEGIVSSEDTITLAGRNMNPFHGEQGEKEALSVEPPVVLDGGHHAVENYTADNCLSESESAQSVVSESIAHGEAGIEPPTSPPTVARREEETEQRDKHGNGDPPFTEDGRSGDLRKVGATCGATW